MAGPHTERRLWMTDFWETFSWQVYLLSELLPAICWKKIAAEVYFFHISFLCLTWNTSPCLVSNKPTHYLLDYGDFILLMSIVALLIINLLVFKRLPNVANSPESFMVIPHLAKFIWPVVSWKINTYRHPHYKNVISFRHFIEIRFVTAVNCISYSAV